MTGTWGSAGYGRGCKRWCDARDGRVAGGGRPERQCGRRRCHGELSVVVGRWCVPIASGTPLHVRESHRPLRADVLSPSSAISIRSQELKNREVLQRTLRRLHSSYRDMKVDRCGLEAGMSKQDLDGTEVRSRIQQICGERVPPNVRSHLLLDADLYGELVAHLSDGGWMHRISGLLPRKQPVRGLPPAPVCPPLKQQLAREHAIPGRLAVSLAYQ